MTAVDHQRKYEQLVDDLRGFGDVARLSDYPIWRIQQLPKLAEWNEVPARRLVLELISDSPNSYLTYDENPLTDGELPGDWIAVDSESLRHIRAEDVGPGSWDWLIPGSIDAEKLRDWLMVEGRWTLYVADRPLPPISPSKSPETKGLLLTLGQRAAQFLRRTLSFEAHLPQPHELMERMRPAGCVLLVDAFYDHLAWTVAVRFCERRP